MATWKRHNSGTVKDTCKMFAPNRGFSWSDNQTASFKFLLDPPLLPWQQVDVFGHKIGYYSACIGDINKVRAPNRYFGVGRFNCVSEICTKPTPVAMVTKI